MGTSGVYKIDARKPAFLRNRLRAQMFLDCHWKISAPFDCGVVSDYHAVLAVNSADGGDYASAGHLTLVQVGGGERAEFEHVAALVDEPVDPVAHEQLAARRVPPYRVLRPAAYNVTCFLAQLVDELVHFGLIFLERGVISVRLAAYYRRLAVVAALPA